MVRILIAGSALALASPALAQETGTAGAAAGSAASQTAQVVESEFPVYDADRSGYLNASEFSKWLVTLKQQDLKTSGKTMSNTEMNAWVSAAFATADADRSTTVSKDELTGYLGG